MSESDTLHWLTVSGCISNFFMFTECVFTFEPLQMDEIFILAILCDATNCISELLQIRGFFQVHFIPGWTNRMVQYD